MNCFRSRQGRPSVAAVGRCHPASNRACPRRDQQPEVASSCRFTTGGDGIGKAGNHTRPSSARDREPDVPHHLDLRCHNADRAPGHPPGLGGQQAPGETSPQRHVTTGGDVEQAHHCTASGLRSDQAGGGSGALLGTEGRSDPQEGG